jgi:cell filamentation protein
LSGDPYSDPVTGVLINKLGLGSPAALEAAEREITHAALIGLDEAPATPTYDLGASFCLPQYIESSATVIFGELRGEDFLRGLDRDAFTGRLACYLGEVNALHPFREGNGRAQRAFVSQLARAAGYVLTWQHLDPARNIEASAASLRGDAEPLRKMLDSLVNSGTRVH